MEIYSNTMLGMRAAPQGSSIGGLRARRVLSLLHPLNRSQSARTTNPVDYAEAGEFSQTLKAATHVHPLVVGPRRGKT